MMRSRSIVIAGIGLLVIGTPSIGLAQDPDATRSIDVKVAALRECRTITDDTVRLACYDKQTTEVLSAIDGGEAKIVTTEEVEQTRRGLFGFSMPKLGLFKSDDGEEIDMLESTITGVRASRNSYDITIAEGSTWRINNPPMRLRAPKIGDPVVLKKAALSSFFVRIDGQTGVKGSRIR